MKRNGLSIVPSALLILVTLSVAASLTAQYPTSDPRPIEPTLTILPNVLSEMSFSDFSIDATGRAIFSGRLLGHGGFVVFYENGMLRKAATDNAVNGTFFLTTDEGWMSSGDQLMHTFDGGRSGFQNVPLKGVVAGPKLKIDFTDAANGWIVDNDGKLFAFDGKRTRLLYDWSKVGVDIPSIKFFTAKVGYLLALRFGRSIKLMKTLDGGSSWSTVGPEAVHEFYFIDERHGWFTSAGELFGTGDGMKTFGRVNLPGGQKAYKIFFLNAQFGWVYTSDGEVCRTTNSGGAWSCVTPDIDGFNEHLGFIDEMHGWLVVGDNVYATNDGGVSWNRITEQFRKLLTQP